jgi:AcrR family transcriptional regulator
MSPLPTDNPLEEETRVRILDAAEARFREFGFNKTTMAEIATDVGMSAANLYRYFENKQDIAAACARRCMGACTESLRQVVRQLNVSAARRLQDFIQAMLQHSWENSHQQPRINELVSAVTSQRPEIVHENIRDQIALLTEIVAAGNASGEFAVDDVVHTARAVYASLTLFEVPLFMSLYPRAEFEAMARCRGAVAERTARPLKC